MSININNQSSYSLDHHFRGARIAMRPLYEEIIAKLAEEMAFELKVGKIYIGLIHTLVFTALHIQTKKIIVEFVSRKEVSHTRIFKTKHFQKRRWAYYVEINSPTQFDRQLIQWIKESHE